MHVRAPRVPERALRGLAVLRLRAPGKFWANRLAKSLLTLRHRMKLKAVWAKARGLPSKSTLQGRGVMGMLAWSVPVSRPLFVQPPNFLLPASLLGVMS